MKPGDIVYLNSGGPPMTVTGVDGDTVTTVWMEGVEVRNYPFPVVALVPNNPAPVIQAATDAVVAKLATPVETVAVAETLAVPQ